MRATTAREGCCGTASADELVTTALQRTKVIDQLVDQYVTGPLHHVLKQHLAVIECTLLTQPVRPHDWTGS